MPPSEVASQIGITEEQLIQCESGSIENVEVIGKVIDWLEADANLFFLQNQVKDKTGLISIDKIFKWPLKWKRMVACKGRHDSRRPFLNALFTNHKLSKWKR